MTLWDILLILIYLPICLQIGKRIKRNNRHNPLYQKWFMKGLWIKLFGSLAFCFVYTFYYDYGGDTRGYFNDSNIVVKSLLEGFDVFWSVFTRTYENVDPAALDLLMRITYDAPMEYFTVNIGVFFNILGFGSYFAMSLLIALFSYWGVWHFFLLFHSKYPRLEKQMAFAILFIPSVWFWGSGLSKDTFILCFIGLFLYYLNRLLNGRVFDLKAILIVLISGYLMFVIKAYVLISLVPAIVVWRTLYLRDKIRVAWIRALILPVVGSIAVVGVVYALSFLGQYNKKYSVDNFVSSAQSMQGWHYQEGHNTSDQYGRGSSYTLGNYDESAMGLLKIFPAAVNVTFFRPYLWEVKNAGMLAQAMESLLFLYFTIAIIIRTGIFKTYNYISNDSFLLMCVIFAVFFGFAVGFSSYNFGALSRYKIQCVPFYVAALFIIRYKAQESKRLHILKTIKKREFRQGSEAVPGFAR